MKGFSTRGSTSFVPNVAIMAGTPCTRRSSGHHVQSIRALASLWESVLPEEALRMPAELSRVDELLDDPAFFEPFRPFFHPVLGRKSVPMETFLRLMYLKYRYRVGFEALCREVADSASWSRFCRVPFGGSVPDHSTLKKIAKRCGPEAVEESTAAYSRRLLVIRC